MKRLLLIAALSALCLGQMCAPQADHTPPTNDTIDGGTDTGEPADDSNAETPGTDTGGTEDDPGSDDGAGTPSDDGSDDTPPPDDTADDDDSGDEPVGDDTGDGSDDGTGDGGDGGDDATDPPPSGGGGGGTGGNGEDPTAGPCSNVDFTGTWTDGDRLFELTQSGDTIVSRFAEGFVCDHEDGQGTTSTTDQDFTATLDSDCTITGTITVCRFGCTPEADDCTLDQNGIATVEFEGEVSEAGDIISIDFTDPLTGDSFSLVYTLEP